MIDRLLRWAYPEAILLDHRVYAIPGLPHAACYLWGRVLVACRTLDRLNTLELHAVIAHERFHRWWHAVMLVLAELLVPSRWVTWLSYRLEFAADDFAVRHGLGLALADALAKLDPLDVHGITHPPTSERIRRLRRSQA